MTSVLIAMFGMGVHELLIVLLIFLLLFGSSKLPTLMRSVGASAREFKKGVQGVEDELDDASKSLEQDEK